jgi:hypothetical protein
MKLISRHNFGALSTIAMVEAHNTLWCVELRGGKTYSIRDNATDKAMRRNSGRFNTLASFVEYSVRLAYDLEQQK